MQDIYKKAAGLSRYPTNPAAVERGIRALLKRVYEQPHTDLWDEVLAPLEGKYPTAREFVLLLSDYIKKNAIAKKQMSFETVLKFFHIYLNDDECIEIFETRRGRLVAMWSGSEYEIVDLADTPEDLLVCLLDTYESFILYEMTTVSVKEDSSEYQQAQKDAKAKRLEKELLFKAYLENGFIIG